MPKGFDTGRTFSTGALNFHDGSRPSAGRNDRDLLLHRRRRAGRYGAGLFARRAGIDVWVLEKHGDFLRDFRGDTIHPSTLDVMHELGILDDLLERHIKRRGN